MSEQLKKRPVITILGLRNEADEPWHRHATDSDLQMMAEDPAGYEPRDETLDGWGWP